MSKTKNFLHEFQEFAVKGNMIDLAVGVIIGAAFSKIIDSLVSDIVMPIISFILRGEVDFTNQFLLLRTPEGYTGPLTYEELTAAGAVILSWGNFLTILINFILLAFVVFMLVKMVNSARNRVLHREKETIAAEPPAPEPTPDDVLLLQEIRDLLKRQGSPGQ